MKCFARNLRAACVRRLLLNASLALAFSSALPAQTTPSMVQVPTLSVYAGIPSATYNGVAGTACPSGTTGRLDSNGNGCPATQALLSYSYGLAIDSYNNLYTSDYSGSRMVRVVYQGGSALSAALVAGIGSSSLTTPVVGNIYGFGGVSAVLTASSGTYYCSGSSGATALNQDGDGCPAHYAAIRAFGGGMAVDKDGNIFFANNVGTLRVSVIYVGGTALSTLIANYYKTVYGQTVTPQVGYVYALSGGATSSTSEFVYIRSIAVDSSENIYVADSGTRATISGYLATTSGNQIKKFGQVNGVWGWTTYIDNGGTAGATDGDGAIATSAQLNAPYNVFVDKYDNLYIGDSGVGRIRVVYNSGTTPPLYSGASQTVVSSPVAGYIYSVAGNTKGTSSGTSAALGLKASAINFGTSLQKIGMDQGGNLLLFDSNSFLWRISASTGVAEAIGGMSATTANDYTASSTAPAAGVACNGGSTGPIMTDAYGDGCPATEVIPYGFNGNIVSDTSGNLYWLEARNTSYAGGIIRKATFGGQFGSVAVGSSSSAVFAFTPTGTATYTPTPAYSLAGGSTNEFADAGSDLCNTLNGFQTCIYNTKFSPASAGVREGSFALTNSSGTLGSAYLSGVGTAARLTADPGSTATVSAAGVTVTPSGVAVDQNGNAYLADTTTNKLYKSAGGTTLAALSTGTTGTPFSSPAQVAVDGAGDVYVADAGNNRIVQVTSEGVASVMSLFGASGSATALSAPAGVAVDGAGNLYIADTGNNRVLKLPSQGIAYSMAFSGLSSPKALALDAAGDVYVVDSGNARVVELTPVGVQSTVSVSPSPVTPVGIAVDAAGDLFLADSGRQSVILLPSGSSTPTTLLGSTAGLAALAADTGGNVYLAATSANGLLKLNRSTPTIAYPQTALAQTSTNTITLSNNGNTALALGSTLGTLSDSADFAVAPSTSNGCSVSESLSVAGSCNVVATFQPQSTGSLSSTLTFASTAISSAVPNLVGVGIKSTPTVEVTNTSTVQGIASITLTATISYGLSQAPKGALTFTVGSGSAVTATCVGSASPLTCTATYPTASLTTNTYTITAALATDNNYAGASGTGTLAVTAYASATVSITGTPSVTYGTSTATLTAAVAYSAGIAAPTGAVSFVVGNGSSITATCTGSSSPLTCTASYPTKGLAVGAYTITVSLAADSKYLTSSATATLTVTTAHVAVAVIGSPSVVYETASTALVGTLTYSLSGTPTGAVTFAVPGGNPVAATCSGTTSPITCTAVYPTAALAAGSYAITMTYAGDSNFGSATSNSTSLAVTAAPTTTLLQVADNLSAATPNVTLTASVSSSAAGVTGTVVFFSGSVSLASAAIDTRGIATLTLSATGIPSSSLTAQFTPATSNYTGSTSATVTESSDFILSTSLTSITVAQAASGTFTLALTPYFGVTSISLKCGGLPTGSGCSFSPASPITFTSGSTASVPVTLTVKTNNVITSSVKLRNRPGSSLPIEVAFAACVGCLCFRRRKLFRGIAMSILGIAMLGAVSGCGSAGPSSITPVGSYPFTVTATDQSGTTHSVSLVVVVTVDP